MLKKHHLSIRKTTRRERCTEVTAVSDETHTKVIKVLREKNSETAQAWNRAFKDGKYKLI